MIREDSGEVKIACFPVYIIIPTAVVVQSGGLVQSTKTSITSSFFVHLLRAVYAASLWTIASDR